MNIPPPLVYEFLRDFARVEYALKGIRRFCLGAEGEKASANWDRFANEVAKHLVVNPQIDDGIRHLLLQEPPMKEVVRSGISVFESRPLEGTDGAQLLFSVRRVRNNVFHGGKEHHERYLGHDQELVRAALVVLRVSVSLHAEVNHRFHH